MPTDLQFLALNGSLAARSVADTLAALLGGESNSVPSEDDPLGGQTECAVMVLTCMDAVDQIRALPGFRSRGFRGPVLILSDERLDDLKQSHKILRWTHGARDVFGPDWLLPSLLEKATQLQPMGEETLWHLQQLLFQRSSEWDKKFSHCLSAVAMEAPLLESLGDLERVFGDLCKAAPMATHDEWPLFQRGIEDIRRADRIDDHHMEVLNSLVRRALDRLRETSEAL